MADNDRDGLRAVLGAMAGVDPVTEADDHARDILGRARWAKAHNDGHPNEAWSHGEQLAVALVLDDHGFLDRVGYTVEEATARVAGGMYFPPADMDTWLDGIRTQLTG